MQKGGTVRQVPWGMGAGRERRWRNISRNKGYLCVAAAPRRFGNHFLQVIPVRDNSNAEGMLATSDVTLLFVSLESVLAKAGAGQGANTYSHGK